MRTWSVAGGTGNSHDFHYAVGVLKRRFIHFGYGSAKMLIRLYGRVAWDLQIVRSKTPPAGPKIWVSNHVTSIDPYLLMLAIPEFLHFVVGPSYQIRGAAPILRAFEQINALRAYRKGAVAEACAYIERGESICICPEADVQKPFVPGPFFTGFAQMYCKTRAPMVPIAIGVSPARIRRRPKWDIVVEGQTFEARMYSSGPIRMRIAEPMTPEIARSIDENEHKRITDLVRDRIAEMLNELRREFEL